MSEEINGLSPQLEVNDVAITLGQLEQKASRVAPKSEENSGLGEAAWARRRNGFGLNHVRLYSIL
jgi:hypothetical protein